MQPLYQLLNLFKDNKFFRTAVIFGALFLLLVITLSPRKSSAPIPLPLPSSPPHTLDTQRRPELAGLEEERLRQAADYRALIADRLPIYIEGFKTSVGITTSINLYYLKSDPASTLRFEIYGLSFANNDSTPLANPNMTAFAESYRKGISELKNHGMDPSQFIFIYSDTEYVRNTAASWIKTLRLTP